MTSQARKKHHVDNITFGNTNNVWQYIKWTKGNRHTTMPPILNTETNKFEHDLNAKAEVIKKTLLDIPINPNVQVPEGPYPERIAWKAITKQEIDTELAGYNTDTAPGQSKITYTILKWLNKAAPTLMTTLYSNILELGFHPACLKSANVAVVPNPNKPNYTLAKAYRPIALLECLSKVLEKVITKRLNFYVNKYELIPNTQFAGRTKSSVEDAGLCLTHDIQAAWSQNLKMSVLFFDISGYFNNMHHGVLLDTLRRKSIPEAICKWLSSFLKGRAVNMILNGVTSAQMMIMDIGVPQGLPLSPILSSFYTAPMLDLFSDGKVIFSNMMLTPIELVMYIDDGSIRAVSKSLQINCMVIEEAYNRVHKWMEKSNLSLDMEKRDLIHFDKGKLAVDPVMSVMLPNKDGTTTKHKPQEVAKWLGIFFDQKLSFRTHVNIMAQRAETATNAVKILGNTVRGLPLRVVQNAYLATVRPVLTYGSNIWYKGDKQKG